MVFFNKRVNKNEKSLDQDDISFESNSTGCIRNVENTNSNKANFFVFALCYALICIIGPSTGTFKPNSNFPIFWRKKIPAGTFEYFFKNSFPTWSFWANKKKFEFPLLSPDGS